MNALCAPAMMTPWCAFADLLLVGHRCFQIFGVHRMSALKKLPAQGSFAHADRILLAQLGLLGRFYEAPQRLFISTKHGGQSIWTMPPRTSSQGFSLDAQAGFTAQLGVVGPQPKQSHLVP